MATGSSKFKNGYFLGQEGCICDKENKFLKIGKFNRKNQLNTDSGGVFVDYSDEKNPIIIKGGFTKDVPNGEVEVITTEYIKIGNASDGKITYSEQNSHNKTLSLIFDKNGYLTRYTLL